MNNKKLTDALAFYKQAITKDPNNPVTYAKYASLIASSGKIQTAREMLVKFLSKEKGNGVVVNYLLPLIVQEEQFQEAINKYKLIKKKYPNIEVTEDVLISIGYSYEKLHKYTEAIKFYSKADLQNPKVQMSLGHAYRFNGELEKSIACYKECIKDNGEYLPNAYWSLSNLKNYKFNEKETLEMESWLQDNKFGKNKHFIYFALGYAFEQSKDYEKSYTYYQKGNNICSGKYNAVKQNGFTNALIESFGNFSSKHSIVKSELVPIFIVGMPRSGSTLVEQILSSHSKVERLGELPYINQLLWEFEQNSNKQYPLNITELRTKNIQKFRRYYYEKCKKHLKISKGYFTDKNPNNFENIGFIKTVFPEAIIIDTRRDFRANAFSLYKQLFIRGQEYSYSFTDIENYYKNYIQLMSFWNELYPEDIYLQEYEANVNKLEESVRSLLDFCDLEFEENCLEFYNTKQVVDTASSEQVRQPIYKSGLDYWENYKSYLPTFLINNKLKES